MFYLTLLPFISVFVFIAIVVSMGGMILILNSLLGLKSKTSEKLTTYESGIEVEKRTNSRVSINYYLVSILFIIFDVEIVFMYPWASLFDEMTILDTMPMVSFLILMFVGYIYVLKKKALTW